MYAVRLAPGTVRINHSGAGTAFTLYELLQQKSEVLDVKAKGLSCDQQTLVDIIAFTGFVFFLEGNLVSNRSFINRLLKLKDMNMCNT